MEKIHGIKSTQKIISPDIINGYYITLECCMCGNEQTFTEYTINGLKKSITDNWWREIESEAYQIMGLYCGCDYMD